ncbi:TonB-linked SusC/RagA family outer membrane protein [Parabacteroides sp. PF5-6]|nr:TonB-linked SusC/RagA family outer membrane protein [Parabacteroides sp. PF5-6]
MSMLKIVRPVSLLLLLTTICSGKAMYAAGESSLPVVHIALQQSTVKGVVEDAYGPIIGASVIVKGTTNGMVTNLDGNFELNNLKQGDIIQVSYIGYLTQEIPYSGQSSLRIVLREDTQKLEEVVVVGYGTQKKVNLTGSVANVDNKLFENRPITNVSSGLQGLLPGVSVVQSSGQPGSDTGKIRVRGTGTLNSADPMVIVDGVESTMNDIDANDVETISVLKDAASAAIYGSKAANGVILITTKRGKTGKTSINYSGNFGFTQATRIPEYFSSAQVAEYWNAALEYEGSSPIYTAEEIRKYKDGSDPENYPNTNWHDLVYKTAFQQTHNVNVSGGSDAARYMASLGYQGQDGIIDNYNKNQYNMRLNLDMKPTDKMETSFSMAYTQQDINSPVGSYSDGSTAQILRLLNRISPMVVGQYSDGTYGAVSDGNPLAWIQDGGTQNRKVHNLMAVGSAKYQFLPSLSLKAQVAYKLQMEETDKYTKRIQYNPTYAQGTTSKAITGKDYDRITFDLTPEYKKSFGKHNLGVLGGFHSELYKYKYSYSYRSGYPNTSLTDLNAGSASTAKAEGYTRELAMISYFGRVNYDYDGKYLFEANIRHDGSSRFSKDNRWGTFPAVSAGWRLSEEGFFEGLKDKVNNLKLRASWGKLGNQEILDSDGYSNYYPTVSTMTLGKDYVLGGSLESGAHTYYAVNSDLKWEETTTWGAAIDIALLDKVSFTAEYYNKTTSGVIMEMSTPNTYALSSYFANLAKIRNSGIELSVAYNDKFGDVGFNFGGNVAFNKNEVLNIGTNEYEYVTGIDNYTAVNWVGHSMNSIYAYETAGIFQTQEELDNWAEYGFTSKTRRIGDVKYVDTNGDGKVTAEDRTIQGSTDPKIAFGFNFGLTYKQFDLIAFFQGAAKVSSIVSEGRGGLSASTSKPHNLWLDSWTPDNTNAKYPRLATSNADINTEHSDIWVMNASYLRMKDLQIGYTFPKSLLDKIGIQRLRIYYSGQNLFTLTGMLDGWDPEAPAGRGNAYPQTVVNSFGLNLTF